MATILISKQNFYYNLNQIALKTGSVDKIAVVLKDNAYGHGLDIMASLASEFGVKHAVVKNMAEAESVKHLFQSVLILNGSVVKDKICSFAINSLTDIEEAEQGAKVELKVDTGMHRNGIAAKELDLALKMIQKRALELVGVMTHFRSADEMGSEFFWQQKQFGEIKEKVRIAGFEKVRFHSHNSAAVLRSKTFDEDLVRVGISIYGYNELPYPFDEILLKPVMLLSAKKTATRHLKKGERVGYGGDFAAPTAMTVSTYDLGYGDGWRRGDSSHPYVTAEGLPILGRVSMDFIVLESKKEEVLIMNNAQKAAKHFATISYEMTTALSENIKRIIV
jgi:alanine racemase